MIILSAQVPNDMIYLLNIVSTNCPQIVIKEIDLKLRQNIEHLSLDRFQRDYERCEN